MSFKTFSRVSLAAVIIFVVCLLPTGRVFADARNWNVYCITGGDCSLYDPNACGAAAPTGDGSTAASMDISEIVKKYDLQSAVVQKLGGNVIADHNADSPPASPASTMKLVIADVVLQEKIDLNKVVPVTSSLYYDGSNDLGVSSITVGDALTKMLGVSSNVAANVLMNTLGGVSAFTQKAHEHGYNGTDVKAYYSSGAMGKNKSTIGDQAGAMEHIFSGKDGGYDLAKNALKKADDHYGVGGVARKWAGNSLVTGNVGLFNKEGTQYVVGVYYNGNYTDSKSVAAVKSSTADIVTKIGRSGAMVTGKAVGNLPPGGKKVGASYYDGGTGYRGDSLKGTYSYAELGNFKAMGDLKHKQKLAITYKGKTVIAEKLDVGTGGDAVNGKERAIDLYQKTAEYLGMISAGVAVVHVQGVDENTPLGPVNSSEISEPEGTGETPTCCPATGTTTGAGNAEAEKGVWDSGLKPPYILEQWAIETLKNVAAKMKTDQADAVTKEHVVALIAFAMGEGGDIMNSDLFNPLNTGINAPELIDGAHSGSGVQAFKSFDAGVEAAARTIVGSNQDRLADVLTKPQTTAKQFMYALTYFNKYPGNKFWAEASLPDPGGYYRGRLTLVNMVRANYKGTAGLVIGTPAHEQQENKTEPSLLQFQGGGGGAIATGGGGLCGDGLSGDGASIAQTAVELSWPDASHGITPKPEYKAALNRYNNGMNPADCGIFVATVMRASGADPKYPASGTSIQEAYVRDHPEKYDVVDKVDKVSDLQPGDILIVNKGGGAGADGHTFIYVGKQPNGGFDAASASWNSRAANLGNTILSDGRGDYMRARLK